MHLDAFRCIQMQNTCVFRLPGKRTSADQHDGVRTPGGSLKQLGCTLAADPCRVADWQTHRKVRALLVRQDEKQFEVMIKKGCLRIHLILESKNS